MSDGKVLVRVELTFHKKLPTPRVYKKWAESRRQPAPPAGEYPRQPAPARRPSPRREPAQMETLPPPPQTTTQTPQQIIKLRYKNTATITDYHQTSTSVSRVTAVEEAKKKVSRTSERPPNTVLLRRLWRTFPDPREVRPPGCSQQQAPWKRRYHHQGQRTPARRRRDEYRLTCLLSSPTMETGLAIHQGTNVEVLPRGVLQQDGGASRIRKVIVKHHILVRFPGACIQRPIGKVQIHQSSTTVETWVRTPFWLMGEDTLRYLITWVRTPYQRSGWGHPAPPRQPRWGHPSGDSLSRLVSETSARLELST